MTIRETRFSTNTDMHLHAAAAMVAEIATEETNESLAKKAEQKNEKKRSGNKILSLHAPKLTAKQTAPSAAPTAPSKPAPPVIIPGITVLANSSSQNNQEAFRQKTVEQLWNTLRNKAEDFIRSEAANAADPTTAITPPPAPQFTPAEQREAVNMASYMLAILTASIGLANDQNTVSGQTNDLSEAMVKLNAQEAKKAVDDLNTLLQQEYDLAHESFWEKLKHAFTAIGHLSMVVNPVTCTALLIHGGPDDVKDQWNDFTSDLALSGPVFQEVVSGLMIIGGAASGNVGLVMMGTMMLAMSASGGQNDLNNWLANNFSNTGLRILMDVTISLVMAVALCGVTGAVTALFSETAATGTTVVAETAEESAEESAESSTAGAGGTVAAAPTAQAATTQANTLLDTFYAYLKRAAANGFGSTGTMAAKNLVVKSIMTAGLTPLWNDIIKGIINGINECNGAQTGHDKEEEVAAIAGAVLGAVAVMGSSLIETDSNEVVSSVMKRVEATLTKQLTETGFLIAKRSFLAFGTMMALLAAGQSIQAGVNELHQADILIDMGSAMAAQSIYTGLIDIVDSIITSNNTVGNEIHSDFAAINSRWDSIYVTPWNV